MSKLLKTVLPDGFREPESIQPREDSSPEHPYGFACHGCRFRTVSLQLMSRHFSDEAVRDTCTCYNQAPGRVSKEELFQYVYLQA
jgi:hypothetical protein